MRKYNLSLVFYPQDTGDYSVICPELQGCFSCGKTVEEAEMNIRELIHVLMMQEIEDETDAEMLAEGLAVKGKLFREIEIEA